MPFSRIRDFIQGSTEYDPFGERQLTAGGHREGAAGIQRYLGGRLRQRGMRAERLASGYEEGLADPTQAGRRFQGFFNEAGTAIAAPAMRDFEQQLGGVRGETAARFGGNVSSEELRNVYNTSDLFTRNLTEALARLAPQAAGLGLDYIGELGQGARGEGAQELETAGLGLEAARTREQIRKRGGGIGRFLGTAIGGIGGFLAGGPAGAAVGAAQGYNR